MTARNQTEETIRAASQFSAAAERLSSSLDRFLELQGRREVEPAWLRGERLPGETIVSLLGAGGLSDKDAGRLADDVVHLAREELGREIATEAPSREDISLWWHGDDDSNGPAH